jgi:hypothetical protein
LGVGAAMTFDARRVPSALFGANTLSDNAGPAIVQRPLSVYTRGDNAILQPTPVSGTLTPIPAY